MSHTRGNSGAGGELAVLLKRRRSLNKEDDEDDDTEDQRLSIFLCSSSAAVCAFLFLRMIGNKGNHSVYKMLKLSLLVFTNKTNLILRH